MLILRIFANDREIMRTEGEGFCSLSWDIVDSLHEELHIILDVNDIFLNKYPNK